MFQNAYKFVDDAAAAKPAPPRAISEWMAKEREARAKVRQVHFSISNYYHACIIAVVRMLGFRRPPQPKG